MFGNLGYAAIDHGPEHEQEGYGAGVGREMAGEPRPDPLGKDSSPLMCEYLAQKEQSDVRRGPYATEMSRYGCLSGLGTQRDVTPRGCRQ
jgi:hypothetical protein